MRTLTSVFAPGSAPLPEGLRTLNVSPARTIEPGQTIHASFTFRNLGGGTATGFRVRFRLPEGLTYLVGTAQIDGVEVDEQGGLTSLLQSSGAKLGDVPAGGERRDLAGVHASRRRSRTARRSRCRRRSRRSRCR